jgi:hypothetical protein
VRRLTSEATLNNACMGSKLGRAKIAFVFHMQPTDPSISTPGTIGHAKGLHL